MMWTILCVTYFYLSSQSTQSFMIDTKDPRIYYAQHDGYYFGYSIAIHKTRQDNKNWLIVGAPLGNDTSTGNRPRHGAIYKCDLASKNKKCSVIKQFDKKDAPKATTRDHNAELRKGQWLGATVQSVNNIVLGCSPRLAYTGYRGDTKWLALLGKCQLRDLENDKNDNDWEPCKANFYRGRDFYYCQIGLGASMTPDAQAITSGALGILNQQGRVFYTLTENFGEPAIYTGGANLASTDYMGYTVTTGKFRSDKSLAIAGGAPRGHKLKGLVILYKLAQGLPLMTVLANPSKQIGSYFGSVLTAADVNGDGFSDLLVGAPFFSKTQDEGIVYVYLNNQKDSLDVSSVALDGDNTPGAKFGWSIASVGDLNLDHYDDIAIGAPYGGPDGKGAVYIYQGSRQGLENKYIQRILPSSFDAKAASTLSTFGNSITGGIDVDNNGYPDLAVGSFMSDRVTFLRSRAIVSIIGSITLNLTKISLSNKKSFCKAPDHKVYKCANAKICFNSFGKGVPTPIGITYTFEVDKRNRVADKRVVLFEKGVKSHKLSKNITSAKSCFDHVTYILNNTRDVFKPLVFDVSYDYIPPKGCELCPVMNAFLPKSSQFTATFVKDCGKNDICEADLSVDVTPVIPGGLSKIHIGVVSRFSLHINVVNKGEDAYLPLLSLVHSNDVSIVGVYSISKEATVKPLSDWDVEKIGKTHNSKLIVNIENPMRANVTRKYEVKFDLATAQPASEIPFQINVTTASNETNPQNNAVKLNIGVLIIADVTISGVAFPDQVTYRNTATLKTNGPTVTHTLLVQNKGPSSVESSTVTVRMPRKLKNNFLLNLLAVSVEGSGSCAIDQSLLNPLHLNDTGIAKDNTNKTNRRKRRDTEERLDCTTSDCMDFQCNLGRLLRGDNIVIKLKSTIVEKTFSEFVGKPSTIVLFARVKPIGIHQPKEHLTDKTEVEVTINEPLKARREHKQKEIPWWVILVSVLAGLILIAGVSFLCYKKGFFKRKKHEKVSTEEPLNEEY